MKKISTILALLSAIAFLAVPSTPRAQTITLDSISGTQFCAGDPVSVTFTATGTWGHKNAFTLQLSNDSGSFDNGFQNLGSIVDTAPGTFTIESIEPYTSIYRQFHIDDNVTSHDSTYLQDSAFLTIRHGDTTYDTIPFPHLVTVFDTTFDTTQATHYRFRIMGANPYMVSADNGTDIVIGQSPGTLSFFYNITKDTLYTTGVGIPIQFGVTTRNAAGVDTLHWSFGDGAKPATSTYAKTTYSTGGLKMVTVRAVAPGGCSVSDTTYAYVFDCTTPAIPNDAIVISNDTDLSMWDDSLGRYAPSHIRSRAFWINPGVTVYANEAAFNTYDTIFAEAGATVNAGSGNIIYLKPGAAAFGNNNGIIIYDTGTSIDPNDAKYTPELECTDLSFDYSTAPPNSIMHINDNEGVVAANTPPEQIEISPNPTSGIVTLEGVPAHADVTAMNVLGETVQNIKATGGGNVMLDLSKVARGTYYIRIASNGSVTTKKIVKE